MKDSTESWVRTTYFLVSCLLVFAFFCGTVSEEKWSRDLFVGAISSSMAFGGFFAIASIIFSIKKINNKHLFFFGTASQAACFFFMLLAIPPVGVSLIMLAAALTLQLLVNRFFHKRLRR